MRTKTLLFVTATTLLFLGGCSMMEDNPTSPEKMVDISKKEDAERRNFSPDMSGKPAAPATTDPRSTGR